ncbi:hypothetical protein THAOC_15448, partial [Thalassiosira oceanica]
MTISTITPQSAGGRYAKSGTAMGDRLTPTCSGCPAAPPQCSALPTSVTTASAQSTTKICCLSGKNAGGGHSQQSAASFPDLTNPGQRRGLRFPRQRTTPSSSPQGAGNSSALTRPSSELLQCGGDTRTSELRSSNKRLQLDGGRAIPGARTSDQAVHVPRRRSSAAGRADPRHQSPHGPGLLSNSASKLDPVGSVPPTHKSRAEAITVGSRLGLSTTSFLDHGGFTPQAGAAAAAGNNSTHKEHGDDSYDETEKALLSPIVLRKKKKSRGSYRSGRKVPVPLSGEGPSFPGAPHHQVDSPRSFRDADHVQRPPAPAALLPDADLTDTDEDGDGEHEDGVDVEDVAEDSDESVAVKQRGACADSDLTDTDEDGVDVEDVAE